MARRLTAATTIAGATRWMINCTRTVIDPLTRFGSVGIPLKIYNNKCHLWQLGDPKSFNLWLKDGSVRLVSRGENLLLWWKRGYWPPITTPCRPIIHPQHTIALRLYTPRKVEISDERIYSTRSPLLIIPLSQPFPLPRLYLSVYSAIIVNNMFDTKFGNISRGIIKKYEILYFWK